MKRTSKILLFIFILLLLAIKVDAKDIYDVACNYKITCYDRDEDTPSKSADFGYVQMQYINIFDRDFNNKLKGTYNVFYSKDGYNSLKIVSPSSWLKERKVELNKEEDPFKKNKKRTITFSYGDTDGSKFVEKFKSNGNKCPTYYCSIGLTLDDKPQITLEPSYAVGDSSKPYNYELKAQSLQLRGKGEDKWQSEQEFYGSSTTTKPAQNCEYKLTPQGDYYDLVMKSFNFTKESIKVKLTTNYNSQTGNVSGYALSVNDSTPKTFSGFNSDVSVPFRDSNNNLFHLEIKKAQLSKIYTASCQNQNNLYLYVSANDTISSNLAFVLTTDKKDITQEPPTASTPTSSELKDDLKYQCTNTDTEFKGCMYNDNTKAAYQKLPIGQTVTTSMPVDTYDADGYVKLDMKGLTFKKAYTSINKKGEMVVGMCHIGYVDPNSKKISWDYNVYTTSATETSGSYGFVYLTIYAPSFLSGNCGKVYKQQILFNTKDGQNKFAPLSSNTNLIGEQIGTYNYNAESMECPQYLIFKSNLTTTQQLLSSKPEYIFTNEKGVKDEATWWSNFLRIDDTGQIIGCLEESTDADALVKQCFNEKMGLINTYQCPSKLSDIKLNSKQYVEECVKYLQDNNVSATYVDNFKKEYQPKLLAAGSEAIDKCYKQSLADNCHLTDSEISSVTSKLKGSVCENACATGTKPEQSTSSTAQCLLCSDGYKWDDVSTTASNSSCHPESGITKDECYGTTDQYNCRKCYNDVVSGLSDDKKTCVINATKEAQKAKKDNEEETTGAFQDQGDQLVGETGTTIDQVHSWSDGTTTFYIPGLSESDFGPDNQKCNEILGKNGIKIVVGVINALRVIGVIIAVANGMITLIPAVVSKDADGLKKAEKKLVIMAVVLAVIGILPTIVYLIGGIFDFDLSCIFKI